MTVSINAGVAYAVGNGVAAAFGGGTTSAATSLRTVLGNRNVLPNTNTTVTTRHRPYRIKKWVAKNANWTQIKVTWSNFVAASTNEVIASYPTQRIAASIKYQGTFYPITWSGSQFVTVDPGNSVTSDVISGLTLLSNTEYEECGYLVLPLLFKTQTGNFTVGQTITGGTSGATGVIVSQTDNGATGSLVLSSETGTFVDGETITDPLGGSALVDLTTTQLLATGMGTINLHLEGVLASNNSANNHLSADPVTRASYTANVTAGNIVSFNQVSTGLNYTSGCTVIASEYINGILWAKSIGTSNRTGTSQTSITLTDGTPPAGLAAWVSPTITLAGGGDFGQSTAMQCMSLTTGIPSTAVKSMLLVGDSITRGYTSSDALGDLYHNFGFHERAIANRCGVINAGISSGTASAYADYAVKYPRSYALYFGVTTHTRISLGINDITTGTSKNTITTALNTIRTQAVNVGSRVAFTKYMPCTTSTDSFATEVNQTPKTGCSSGGVLDLINADIASNTLVSDFAVCDPYSIVRGTDANKWGVTTANTTDGTHLSAYTGIAGVASAVQSSYSAIA